MEALSPSSLRVEPGEFVSVVGPSGCGKSTLLLMVAGLLDTTSGSITVGGRPVREPVTDVGIVFQDDLLLDFRTARDNILLQAQVRHLPQAEAAKEADRLLAKLDLSRAADRYPSQLSGGMRQRVALARALLHAPSLLLMDEAFGALDALTRMQMRHDLEELWMERRPTVFFITHSIDEAVALSDRVIVMSPTPGRIVDVIDIELPRPRPMELGALSGDFTAYTDQIYAIFRDTGVLRF